jgi:hypothetical protein
MFGEETLAGGRQHVVFTRHARERMRDPRRGPVSEEEVLAVLLAPEVRYVGVDGKQNALGTVADKRLRVCYLEDQYQITVITVVNRRGPDADSL